MKKILISSLLLLFTLFVITPVNACTTAVISGKYTKSGRPMLWKNRDTWSINNILRHFDDGKYSYVGLVNSKDLKGKSIWIGINSQGFGIMNSASYNLNLDNDAKLTGLEGRAMKEALATCKNLAEFEAYLDAMPKPSGLEANFGVIDAFGGAAIYEFNHNGYVKFDANDPRVAPFGYIIRTNYSHTGKMGKESGGYIRYNTANELFYEKASTGGLTAQYIQQEVAKSLKHSLTNEDLFEKYGKFDPNHKQYAHFRDYIPRSGSSSSCVVEGVKENEDPNLAMMWSNVGFPLVSMMIPTWVDDTELPEISRYNATIKDSPICHAALQLKNEKVMHIRWGKAERYYINVNALSNNKGTGIAQLVKKHENKIYQKTYNQIKKWRINGQADAKEMKKFYTWLNDYIKETYENEFGITL